MNNEEKLFLKLLQNSLNEIKSTIAETSEISYDNLFEISRTHKCIPFVYIGAKNSNVEMPEEWKKYIVVNTMRNQLYMQTQADILQKLDEASISCAILKGCSAAVYYDEPFARMLGDIDILVNEADFDKAISTLCDTTDDSSHKFHCSTVINGFVVEIHKYVSEYSSEKYGKYISTTMKDALKNITYKKIDEFEFPCLTEEYQAATLLLHTQRHFFENLLPMRMLCDWAIFVKKTDTAIWKEKIYPFVEKMGLGIFCDTLVEVCNKYLKVNCSDKVLSEVDVKTVDYMISEFLKGGVLKTENTLSRGIGAVASQNDINSDNKIKLYILLLNKLATEQFSLAKKSKVFLPVFWIYIPLRYVVRFLLGKRSRFSFGVFNETVERKEYIIKKLNLKD